MLIYNVSHFLTPFYLSVVRFYLTDQGEECLLEYEYHGSDGSPASVLLMPFWNYLTYLLPRNVAPNLITFVSFLFTTSSFILFLYFHPNMIYEGSSMFYFPLCCITSFFFFVNQTLDAVDGKQARRTGNATGLGELFDHGMDSTTLAYISFIVCCLFEYGNSYEALICCSCFALVTPMPTIEECVTGVLRLGSKYNDTTSLLLFFETILIVCGIVGTSLMSYRIEFLSSYFERDVKVSTIFLVWFIALTIFNVADGFRLIFKEVDSRKEEMKVRGISKFSLFMGFLPVPYYCVLYLTWAYMDIELYRDYPALFCVSFNLTCAYTCARIVFCRATKQPLQWTYLVMFSTLGTFIACQLGNSEYKFEVMLIGLVVVNGLIVFHFILFASMEMAEALGIEIFKIKHDMKISDH